MKVNGAEISPVVGVVNNSAPEWLHEDTWSGIDLTYLEWLAENGLPDEDEDAWETIGDETILIGFVECEPNDPDAWYHVKSSVEDVEDVWLKIDPSAEYSAIIGEIYAQVVRSNWVQFVQGCSPCFPFQGDLDSEPEFIHQHPVEMLEFYSSRHPINQGLVDQGYGFAYTLPPAVWGERKPEMMWEAKDGDK